ncbi:MAG: hypothetical protein HY547_01815 [Elusimicrobia bacterium]|nr:hypothetical protein [Elusimicrobiota bacterium]
MTTLKRSSKSFLFAALLITASQNQPMAGPMEPVPLDRGQAPGRIDLFTLDPDSIVIERLNIPASIPQGSTLTIQRPGLTDSPLAVIDRVINLGLKIWDVIDKNRPIADVANQYATALPEGIASPLQLENWNQPHGEVFELTAKNSYGSRVVVVRYQVLRTDGGAYRGQGRYLANVSVQPLLVETLWGYRVNVKVEILDVTNEGTSEDPLAAMTLVLKWRIETPVKNAQGAMVYHVRGDGLMSEIGSPSENLMAQRGIGAVKNQIP